MFNPQITNRIRQVMETCKGKYNPQAKERLIALALARAISVELQLPSSPVNNIFVYYAEIHNERVCKIISEINESYIIDTKFTADMTLKLYKLRYQMVFETKMMTPVLRSLYFDDNTVSQDLLDMGAVIFTPETEDVFTELLVAAKNSVDDSGAPALVGSIPNVNPVLAAG